MGIFRSIWYYLPLFVTDTETSWVYSAVETFEESLIALTWVTSLVNKKSANSSISDVLSSLGGITKLQSGFAMFFVVGAINWVPICGSQVEAVSKWSSQAKIQCKNRGFELKFTQDGVQYGVFYSQASN